MAKKSKVLHNEKRKKLAAKFAAKRAEQDGSYYAHVEEYEGRPRSDYRLKTKRK